jgi:tetratricopeptide (TPR) repeat protein
MGEAGALFPQLTIEVVGDAVFFTVPGYGTKIGSRDEPRWPARLLESATTLRGTKLRGMDTSVDGTLPVNDRQRWALGYVALNGTKRRIIDNVVLTQAYMSRPGFIPGSSTPDEHLNSILMTTPLLRRLDKNRIETIADTVIIADHDALRDWVAAYELPSRRRSAPPTTATSPKLQLPAYFVKRQRLQTALENCIETRSIALISMHGLGGVGKTTLAKHYALSREACEGGYLWVDVREPPGTALGVLESIVRQLGQPNLTLSDVDHGLHIVEKHLSDYTRHNGRVLIILDNADHPEPDFVRVANWLPQTPKVDVLITTRSRELARKTKAEAIEVGDFEPEEALNTLRQCIAVDRLDTQLADATTLLRSVAFHPLMTELLAGYLRARPGEQLKDVYPVFQTIMKSREDTINAVFDLTVSALTPEERIVLTMAAASSAAGVDESVASAALKRSPAVIRAALERLHDVHLLKRDGSRYSLHPLTREHVRRQRSFRQAARKHADAVLLLLGRDRIDAARFAQFEFEANAAVDTMRELNETNRLVALCRRCEWGWRHRGPLTWADRVLHDVLAQVSGKENAAVADLLYAHGMLVKYLGRSQDSFEIISRQERLDRKLGRKIRRAWALEEFAKQFCKQERYEDAKRVLLESLTIHVKAGAPPRDIAITECQVGDVCRLLRDYKLAHKYINNSLRVHRDDGDRTKIALTLSSLGMLYYDQGDHVQARIAFDEALDIGRHEKLNVFVSRFLPLCGMVRVDLEDFLGAEVYLTEGLSLARDMGSAEYEALALTHLGRLRVATAQVRKATEEFEVALEIYQRIASEVDVQKVRSLLAETSGALAAS